MQKILRKASWFLVLIFIIGSGCYSTGPVGDKGEKEFPLYNGFLLEISRQGKYVVDKSSVIVMEDDRYQFSLLFPWMEDEKGDTPLPETIWYKVIPESLREAHPWDMGHRFLHQLEAYKYELFQYVIYLEPDLSQVVLFPGAKDKESEKCVTRKPDTYWPAPARFGWHLEEEYSQLAAAREITGDPFDAGRVRIAHLDTGYDPDQITFPAQRVLFELQHNFVRGEDPGDARDPGVRGFMLQPGHGTGTLSILAGTWIEWPGEDGYPPFEGYLGAAPFQDIVPVRIGKSVVHFYTSAMAEGILYALEEGKCQVVSLSMGGVAAKSWATAVNYAYERGLAVFAASGDRFGISVPGSTVYPARFQRVVSVFAATADNSPYYKRDNLYHLQGSYGPEEKMGNTILGYSPNVPWAHYDCPVIIDLNGAGTSSSTPQAAGAAALWLQAHGQEYPADWRRVEAVRQALFQSADRNFDGYSFATCGNGLLKAADALQIVPPPDSLQKQPEAQVFFPFLTLLFEYFEDMLPKKDMFKLEIAQLHHIEGLHELIPHPEGEAGRVDHATLIKYVTRLYKSKHISRELAKYLGMVLSKL